MLECLWSEATDASPFRRKAISLFHSIQFEAALGAVATFNIFLIILEVDANAADKSVPTWVSTTAHLLLCVYTLELAFRFWLFRVRMFHDPFTMLDTLIVGLDVAVNLFVGDDSAVANLSMLRIVRLAKIARTFELLRIVPELHLMIKGLLGAVKAIFWGAILASFMITVWSILAVAVIHPINKEIAEQTRIYEGCPRCPHAYESVFNAALTFTQQIIAGDSWGQVTVPVIERCPATAIFFFLVFASLALATMNLILAVIVDCAQQARHMSTHDLAKEREIDYQKARTRLSELCKNLDTDGNGMLSLDELQQGFSNIPEFCDVLEVLDIRQEDMPVVFGIMDHDGTGEVSYEEFVKELWKLQSNDVQSMVIYIRFYVTQIRKQLLDQLDLVMTKIVTKIDEEEKIIEKQQAEEAKMLKHMEANEEEMMKQLKEDEKMLKEIGGSVSKNASAPGATFGVSEPDIMNKLETIERTYAQGLALVNESLAELVSRTQPKLPSKELLALPETPSSMLQPRALLLEQPSMRTWSLGERSKQKTPPASAPAIAAARWDSSPNELP